MNEILSVGAEFPPVSTATWEAAIAKDLKGADYEKKLVWRTEEGLAVRPYYRSESLAGLDGQLRTAPGRYPFVRGMGRGWEIAQSAKPGPRAVRADLLHEAGAHAVQELGYGIAAGVETLAALTATLPVDTVAPQIEFVFAVGPNCFVEIAKLRAVRILWAQAVTAFGARDGSACRMRLHVRTPRRNKSVYDRYTNLLRVTTEAFSAAVGGCDQLTVEAFGFDEHLALNVQRILKEEAHLDAVADPAGGSYYIEALTDSLARAGWKLFQEVEAAGGYAASEAAIKEAIAGTRAAREKAYSSRRRVLVGVNNYPDVGEKEAAGECFPSGESRGIGGDRVHRRGAENAEISAEKTKTGGGAEKAENTEKAECYRIAAAFEAIRERTNAHARVTRRYPKVLLLKRGDVKMKGARSNFSYNFFGCAGFDLVESEELGADADLIILCSSDGEYLAMAQDVCPRVTVPVLVAGNPKDQLEALTAAGVAGFVHMGSDAIQTLTFWQDKLGMGSAQ